MNEQAPNFEARLASQRAFERSMVDKKDEYNWYYRLGTYNQDTVIPLYHPTRSFIDSYGVQQLLTGYDAFLQTMVSRLLEAKRGLGPVLCLDIGGGAGASWSRLALCFENEVKKSNLVLVVSNLLLNPEQHLDKKDLPMGQVNFLSQTRHLLHYIKGAYSELGSRDIALPNGQKVSLAGQVDLVNERKSLTSWSKVPEVDIIEVPPLLSPYGLYLVNNFDIWELEGVKSLSEETQRMQGIKIAHRLLQDRYGLKKVVQAEAGRLRGRDLNFVMFKAPKAPLIEVN